MRLSNKQAQMLVEVLRATISISNLETWSQADRKKLYEDIIHQQGDEIVDLDKNGKEQTTKNSPEAHSGT